MRARPRRGRDAIDIPARSIGRGLTNDAIADPIGPQRSLRRTGGARRLVAAMSGAPVAGAARVAAVDGLRGLLAVVVLAWHVAAPFGLAWLLPAANLAVATFFVLSGYVLTRGWDGRYGVFLIRRFLRLWPVYALCLAAGYGVAGVAPVWSEFLWYPVIDADTRPFIDPPVWSLFVEAWAMPFMPLIVWAGAGATLRTVLCMAALVALGILSPRISFGVLFVAGAFLAQFDFRSRPLEAALPQWLGRISYSLYLTHWLVLAVASRAFGPWGGVAALPAVFLVAWAVYRGVERPSIGASRLVARLVAPRRAPNSPPGVAVRGAT